MTPSAAAILSLAALAVPAVVSAQTSPYDYTREAALGANSISTIPIQPCMTMAIEQGVLPPGGPRMAFEDNVLVTETGHEWLSQSIPIEPADVEKMLTQPSSFQTFTTKSNK